MKKKIYIKISTCLAETQITKIDKIAWMSGITRAETIRKAINNYIRNYKRRKL